ncbi:hypothetical protein C0992_002844 [Termitomyces sp. T32_za158]|nr:hypothetical protein C0992_002844 [Termitomyces sp. T32_za158]
MHLHETMPETAQRSAPAGASPWLTDAELDVYTAAYARTGFQGGLNRYRCLTDARWSADLAVFARKTVDVPAMFVAGRKDWGVHQLPGAFERMREVCTRMRGEDVVLVEGAGHWVQQENPRAVVECLIGFLKRQEGEEV